MQNVVILSDGCSPTEDIYLMRSCAVQLSTRQQMHIQLIKCGRRQPEHRLFKTTDIFIVFRTLPPSWISYLEKYKGSKRLIYVLDDDLAAAESTPQLPEKYRLRISAFANTHFDQLLGLADQLVVTSSHLVETYAKYAPMQLNPTAISLPKHASDFKKAPTSIAYHATSSHKQDLAFIASPLINTLDSFNCSFESLLGKQTPVPLRQHRAARSKSPKSYASFRRFQSMVKRHICLAPLFDTPYNKGKSWIKFLDSAAVGAVGIYSNRAPYTEVVNHGVDGLLAGDNPEDWQDCLEYLVSNPGKAQEMAENALQKAERIGSYKRSYRFWTKLLSAQ